MVALNMNKSATNRNKAAVLVLKRQVAALKVQWQPIGALTVLATTMLVAAKAAETVTQTATEAETEMVVFPFLAMLCKTSCTARQAAIKTARCTAEDTILL